jgi:hypothetical protein
MSRSQLVASPGSRLPRSRPPALTDRPMRAGPGRLVGSSTSIKERGQSPSRSFGVAGSRMADARHTLAEHHGVVLHPGSDEIWVAHPFSTAPTGFRVRAGSREWWANCAWCSLGVVEVAGSTASAPNAARSKETCGRSNRSGGLPVNGMAAIATLTGPNGHRRRLPKCLPATPSLGLFGSCPRPKVDSESVLAMRIGAAPLCRRALLGPGVNGRPRATPKADAATGVA